MLLINHHFPMYLPTKSLDIRILSVSTRGIACARPGRVKVALVCWPRSDRRSFAAGEAYWLAFLSFRRGWKPSSIVADLPAHGRGLPSPALPFASAEIASPNVVAAGQIRSQTFKPISAPPVGNQMTLAHRAQPSYLPCLSFKEHAGMKSRGGAQTFRPCVSSNSLFECTPGFREASKLGFHPGACDSPPRYRHDISGRRVSHGEQR
jgi:hypothetical protein